MILMIFVHVGQINTSHVPQQISMAKVNVTGYGDALHSALFDPIFGLYTNNASAPLQQELGLRQLYKFGLYSHCGYVNNTAGVCTNQTAGYRFRPYDAITTDMTANYTRITSALLVNTTFMDSQYLGHSSKAAYYMLLIGTILTATTFFAGITKHGLTFILSALGSIISTLLLLIGASIWTVIIKKCEAVNIITVGARSAPLGIVVSIGSGLYLTWAAFVLSIISIIPYLINCCTYRG
ncbi:hypothetical protein AMATHDRAFT_52566 [Amanita thiersii Skay4041]|uniref:Uncharacterized protein n=1 Tax=Amanita thiersii Skay4041 TaxID=703135 RepID=A0A2A9NUU2_9AGAR|nr:hypothetical protein AMATHDRAFT_52566 [Amanita thiersii Skay4041]